jgi:transposase
MPTKRLTMRRIHRLMTLHFGAGAGTRVIARELGISHSTVREYLARIAAAGITWPLPVAVTDETLERQLFANGGVHAGARHYAEPDWAVVARELKRPGVNLMILWEEYRAAHADGYAYSRYCQLFREFERRLSPSMRQTHVAGDKAKLRLDRSAQAPSVRPAHGGKTLRNCTRPAERPQRRSSCQMPALPSPP